MVLTGLDDEHARVDLAGSHAVSLGELSHFWLGDFVMLWRPASSPVKALSSGMRGAQVRWLPTNGQAACPDCDDNSLAGLLAAGTEFPTGHAHPPAHPGCRCLVTPTPG